MRILGALGTPRAVLATLTAMSAFLIGLAALSNVIDYGTNEAFVRHVLAMDTTFRSPHLMWRAITSPTVVTAAYIAIIAWELLTTVVLGAACVTWLRSTSAPTRARTARQLSTLGWLMLIALFGGGFIVIGGEWFAMWQSSEWNGLQAALQYFIIAAIGLLFTHSAGAIELNREDRTDSVVL